MEESTRKLEPDALDALFAVPASTPGSSLFVINLCASMTPIPQAPVPGFETYRVYQVSRKEDGRIRYRLRMGFFTDEAEAETALACVRDHFPTAFATSLSDEDRKHTRGFAGATAPAPTPKPVAAVVAAKPAAVAEPPKATSAPAPTPKQSTPVAKQTAASDTQKVPALKVAAAASVVERQPVAPASAAQSKNVVPAQPASPPKAAPAPSATSGSSDSAKNAAKPAAPTAPAKAAPASVAPEAKEPSKPARAVPDAPNVTPALKTGTPVELSLASDTGIRRAPGAASATPTAPFHVGKGVEIPSTGITLAAEQSQAAPAIAATSAGKPAATKAAPPVKTPAAKPAAAQLPAKASPAMTPPPPTLLGPDAPRPDLDSTQTIRALTAEELSDETQPKWFAVQLAVSDQAINLDTMPHLDIFSAYRLYSVAIAGSGKILHHMRIGFFKEEVSAEAVSGYLRTFFASPSVVRISAAEYARFSEPPTKPQMPESKANVVELSTARDRTPAKVVPTVTMEVSTGSTGKFPKLGGSATGTFKQPDFNATGSFKATQTGSFNANATGTFKSKAAAKHAGPAVKRGDKAHSSTGKHRSLEQQLLEEARQVELSESGIRKLPKNDSLLSKLFGKK